MRFFFDARYIRTDHHDGISRYSAGIAAALAELVPVTFLIHDPAQLAQLPDGAEHLVIHAPTSAREPFTARVLNDYEPDVVFSPMQTMGAAGRKFALMLTSHDTIYYRHRTPPREFSPALRLGWRAYHLSYTPQRIALNAADAVVTVSETTAEEFRRVRLTKRPIVVVPNAPDRLDLLLDSAPDTTSRPENLIYMGSFMPYKNVEALIQAMAGLTDKTLHLLSRVTPARREELAQLLPAGARVVFHGGVTDAEYAALLADRAVLVTASLDEGFGLPVAEALALGVPAAVTDMPIFREVAGDGAEFFDPGNPADIAAAVRRLDADDHRQEVVAAGRAAVARYTWERSARVLLDAARDLVERRGGAGAP